jgi:predicted Zn-dependent protease
MKRKKTLILLLILFVVLGGGAATYVGAKLVMRRRVAGWKKEGIAASVAGDNARASDLLLRYLQRRPWDVDALSHYIKSREAVELPNGQHIAETIGALKLLLQEEPDRLEDRRHLLELYAKVDRRPEAIETADAIIAGLKKQGKEPDGKTLGIKTDILMRMGRDREALEVATAWKKTAPAELKAHLAHLTLRARLQHPPEELIADVQQLRAQSPNDPQFELLQGVAYSYAKNDDEAIKWLKAAAKRPGLTEEFVEVLLTQLDQIGKSEDAVAVLQDLVDAGAGAKTRHALARRLWERGSWEQAAGLLNDINADTAGTDATLVALKAIALSNLGKKSEAEPLRAALAARTESAPRAWILVLRRVIDGAEVDNKQVVAACQAALALDPENTYLDYYLGDADARLGEVGLAIDAWQRAAMRNASWNLPAVRLVEGLLQKGKAKQALDVAAIAARRSPTNAASIISFARAWATGVETGGAAKSDELLDLVNQIQRQLPGEDQTLFIQLQLMCRKGQKAEAAERIRAAMSTTPPPAQQLFLSFAALSRRYGLQLEQECFTRAEQAHGLTPQLAYAKAIDLLVGGHAEDGLKLITDAAKQGKGEQLDWQLARAKYLDASGSREAAAAWKAMGDGNPDSLPAQQAVVSARAVQADWDFTRKSIDRLHALTGDKGLEWRIAQARLMVESPRTEADYTQGSVLLNEILQEYPLLPEAHALLARALVRMKRVDGATEHMARAAELEPDSVPFALQLAALRQSQGDFERVRQELDRVAGKLRAPAQRRQAALLLAQQGNEAGAIKLLESRQDDDAGQAPQNQLLLATLYRKNGQPDKAEAIVRPLLDRPDPATIEFATSLYASQGRRDDAEQALARLDAMKLDPGVKDLLWAGYRMQTGDAKGAIEHYRAALQQAPTNVLAWRNLAAYQVASGRIDDALATVDDAARAQPADGGFAKPKQQSALLREAAADPSLRPVVIAVIREPGGSEAAMDLLTTVIEGRRANDTERLASRLQQLVERHAGFLPARVQLAQCYLAMGRPNDALATAQQAMKAFPSDASPAKFAVQVAGAQGRWQDALSAAQAWKKRAPNEALAADVAVAKAQLGLGQWDAAVAQLQPHVAAAQAAPETQPDLLMVYCIGLANGGKAKAAADLLWPLTNNSPQWRARWVQVSANLVDPKQAVAWLDRVAGEIPADAVMERVAFAEAYDRLGYDRSGKQTSPELVKKSSELFAGVAADPKATAVAILAAAAQAERAGDVAAAEAFYRRALALDDKLVPAHNNLAMLIARRGGPPQEAVSHAAAAVKLEPRQATLHDTLAFAQSKAGDLNAAATCMSTAVNLEPDNAKWRVRLAQYLLEGGHLPEAAEAVGAIDARRLDLRDQPPALRQQLEAIRKQIRGARNSAAASAR